MHPYLTDRVLTRIPGLARVAAIARAHHEHLDGSGYPLGLAGSALGRPERLLAAAVAYQSALEPRPYREPLSSEAAATRLRDRVTRGALDADVRGRGPGRGRARARRGYAATTPSPLVRRRSSASSPAASPTATSRPGSCSARRRSATTSNAPTPRSAPPTAWARACTPSSRVWSRRSMDDRGRGIQRHGTGPWARQSLALSGHSSAEGGAVARRTLLAMPALLALVHSRRVLDATLRTRPAVRGSAMRRHKARPTVLDVRPTGMGEVQATSDGRVTNRVGASLAHLPDPGTDRGRTGPQRGDQRGDHRHADLSDNPL